MIPIISILNIISALVVFAVLLKIIKSYKNNKNKNVRTFIYFFLFVFIFLLLISAPGIFTSNETLIAYSAAVSYLFLYFALAEISEIPFTFIKQKLFFRKPFILFIGFMMFILNLIFIEPAIRVDIDSFYFYLVQEVIWVRILVGAFPIILATSIAILFLKEAKRQENQGAENEKSAYRSRRIGYGLLIIVIAGIVNFFLYSIYPEPIMFFIASILGIIGWLTIFFGLSRDFR